MKTPDIANATKEAIQILESWLDDHADLHEHARYRSIPFDDMQEASHGFTFSIGVRRFYAQWKSSSSSASLAHAIHFLKQDRENRILMVAVPYMGDAGKRLCKESGVNWMDLCGNAEIIDKSSGLNIIRSGRKNKFITRGQTKSVFAPKSSRVIRWMLLNPDKAFTNTRLVHETCITAGHISKILRFMQEERYITRRVNGEQRLLDAEHLLADWRASYDFFRQNEVIRGHVPARTNEELLETISNRLFYERVRDYAFTGLASAWLHTQFVAFRLVTVYLKRPPSEDMLRVMQFREEPRGANVWLAIPKDDGVFMGAEEISGIPCVSRVQTYLDLKDQPERSDEAAEELYRSLSLGKQNG